MLNAKRPSTNTEIRVWQPVHTCHTYHMVSCLITEGQAFKSGFLTVLWSPDSCPATSALQRLCKEYLPSSSGLQARHTSYLIPDFYPRTRENPERRPDSGSRHCQQRPNHSVVFAPPSRNQQQKVSIWLLPTLICFSSNKPAVYCGDKTHFQPRSYTQQFKNRNQRIASIWVQLKAGNWDKISLCYLTQACGGHQENIRETATTTLRTAQQPPSLCCTGSREKDWQKPRCQDSTFTLYFLQNGQRGDRDGSALKRGPKKTGRGRSCEGSLILWAGSLISAAGAQLLQFCVPSALQGASEPSTAALKQN